MRPPERVRSATAPGAGALDRRIPPAIGPVPSLTVPPLERRRLSNGLELLIVPWRELPVVDLRLVVRTGAAVDPPVYAGRAGIVAEMLDEGTTERSALDFALEVEHLGGEFSMTAGWDATHLSLHVLRSRLEPALALLAEAVLRPTLPEPELRRVKGERRADLLRQLQEPRALAARGFIAAVYGPDHPYGTAASGTVESIARLGRDDVVDFYRSYYRPNHAFLVAAGDVRPEEFAPLVERVLGGWEPGPVPEAEPPARPANRPTRVHLVDKPGAAQSEFRLGHAGPPRTTPDYFPLIVLNTILGGAFTSRLNLALREERGYTYGAGSRFDFRRGPGPFSASSAVFTGVTADAVAVCLDEIRRIREEPVPEDELERARSYLALGLPRGLESTADIARVVAEIELFGLGDDYLERFVDHVLAVSAEEVGRVAREHLDPDAMAIVVVGDGDEVEAPLRELGIGPVEPLVVS